MSMSWWGLGLSKTAQHYISFHLSSFIWSMKQIAKIGISERESRSFFRESKGKKRRKSCLWIHNRTLFWFQFHSCCVPYDQFYCKTSNFGVYRHYCQKFKNADQAASFEKNAFYFGYFKKALRLAHMSYLVISRKVDDLHEKLIQFVLYWLSAMLVLHVAEELLGQPRKSSLPKKSCLPVGDVCVWCRRSFNTHSYPILFL